MYSPPPAALDSFYSNSPIQRTASPKIDWHVIIEGRGCSSSTGHRDPHEVSASIPGKLWRWRIIAGWKWTGSSEHINVLEARATFTTLRWRAEQRLQMDCRCLHLVDSIVVLHCLTRGRSSSRKLRRTVMKIGALLLATGIQPTWAYIGTHQNPADKPSRWAIKKQWLKLSK